MKLFDLHPKAATYASKKSTFGGFLTAVTLIVAVVLIVFLASTDLGQTSEDIRVNMIKHDETVQIEFKISFLNLMSCRYQFRVEVLDALSRKVEDSTASLETSYSAFSQRCQIHGIIHAPAGKGTFRVYPAILTSENIHANHQIDQLLIGKNILGTVPYEARVLSTPEAISGRSGAWSYYLSLVPTTANGVEGFQIAATRTFIEMNNPMGPRGSLFFYYEASPLRMHLKSSVTPTKLFHFLARCLGMISGLFAIISVVRELAFTADSRVKIKKKESSLVM